MDSAVSGRCRNVYSAGRALKTTPPATRRRWNRTASGVLAAALEALDADQHAVCRNPITSNGLDGPMVARALPSVRTSRIWLAHAEHPFPSAYCLPCASSFGRYFANGSSFLGSVPM